jgi:hypothetical protein
MEGREGYKINEYTPHMGYIPLPPLRIPPPLGGVFGCKRGYNPLNKVWIKNFQKKIYRKFPPFFGSVIYLYIN